MWGLMVATLGLGLAPAVDAKAPFKAQPRPGSVAYTYVMHETTNGAPAKGYSVDFDLVSGRDHSLVVVIKRVTEGVPGALQAVTVPDDCRKALKAKDGEVARITVSPLSPKAADLGADFMATCAPDAVFFPMTDILNVTLIQMQSKFAIDKLKAVGDAAHFDSYGTSLTRPSESITAASPGGDTRFFYLDPLAATIDWVPLPMSLDMVEHTTDHGDVGLQGSERFAFRLAIDRHTGELISASTLYDSLALVVAIPGLDAAQAPHVAVTRTVSITRR